MIEVKKELKEEDKLKANYLKRRDEQRQKRINEYRKLAKLDSDEEILEEKLDDWCMNTVCCKYNCDKDRLKAELLGGIWEDED